MTENDETPQKPLTFSDTVKKEEHKVREQERESFEKLRDMQGITKPMPDRIKLAHPKPAFTEAIDAMFKAVAQQLKRLKFDHKNPQDKTYKNKP